MSLRAKYLGAAGVVIVGSLRDIQELRDLEFPVALLCRAGFSLGFHFTTLRSRH